MAGISSKAVGILENRFKFNRGTELNTDLGLDWYETPHRGYDAQLGRFWQIDALSDMSWSSSPYAFASNNPNLRNDPTGLLDSVGVTKSGETIYGGAPLDNVTVRPKPKPRAFWWPSYGGKTGKELNQETDLQLSRLRDGKALLPGGDHAFYLRAFKANQDWRTMNKATLAYFALAGAMPAIVTYAPGELSLLRHAALTPKQISFVNNFSANLFLQYAFNGSGADYADAILNSINIWAGLGGIFLDIKPGEGQLLPSANADNNARKASKLNQSLALSMLQITFERMSGTVLPTTSYLIGVLDGFGGKMIDNIFPNNKE